MKWGRWSFMIPGGICLAIGLMPQFHFATKPAADGATETLRRFTLGVPVSPVLVLNDSRTTSVRIVRPDGGITLKGESSQKSTSLRIVSWSMFSLVLAALLFEADRRSRLNGKPLP